MKTHFPIRSERIEPVLGYIQDMLMHQVEECKAGSLEEENACRTLWLAMKAINRLGTCCNTSTPGAVHFFNS